MWTWLYINILNSFSFLYFHFYFYFHCNNFVKKVCVCVCVCVSVCLYLFIYLFIPSFIHSYPVLEHLLIRCYPSSLWVQEEISFHTNHFHGEQMGLFWLTGQVSSLQGPKHKGNSSVVIQSTNCRSTSYFLHGGAFGRLKKGGGERRSQGICPILLDVSHQRRGIRSHSLIIDL